MFFADEKISIDCTGWWGSSLAKDRSPRRWWHPKALPFVIDIHELQVSAFQLQTAMNVPSPANNNHVLRCFKRLLRFLLTYLSVTLQVSICNVSLCSRHTQMLIPAHSPNHTDWPQSDSDVGRELLGGISHLPFLSHLIWNGSPYPFNSQISVTHSQASV